MGKIVPSPNVLHPSETKISQSTSKKLVNKYKQSQSSIVKRLGIVSVFSSRRKRNCRTENDDVMRKTKKKIKPANKPKMKIDTSIGNIISNTASMETESINENIEMELDFEKEVSNKKSTLKQLKTVPMNEETEVSKKTLSNIPYKSDDSYNIKAKQIVKPKKIEKPEFVPILSRRLARRNFKAKLTPGQKILKRVISKSANSNSASRTLFSNQIEKQINPILEKMNQEYDQSKMIANLKSTKTEKVSMSSKSSNNSDTQPKYRKGELDFLDAAIVSRRHGRKCTVKDNLKEEKFKKPVVLKPKVKRDTSANAEDLSSLIQFAKERRTSSSSTTSTSSEISITSKIRIIESMEDRTSFNSRASDSKKSSQSIKKVSKNQSTIKPVEGNQPTIAESKNKNDLEESVNKPDNSNKGKEVTGVLAKEKGLQSTKLKKKVKEPSDEPQNKDSNEESKSMLAKKGKKKLKKKILNDANIEPAEDNDTGVKTTEPSVENKKSKGEADNKINSEGSIVKKKKKLLKTGLKRRTRNTPNTRSLDIKDKNTTLGPIKKSVVSNTKTS